MTQQEPNSPLMLPFAAYGGIYVQIPISWQVVGHSWGVVRQQCCVPVPTAGGNLSEVWGIPIQLLHHLTQNRVTMFPFPPAHAGGTCSVG